MSIDAPTRPRGKPAHLLETLGRKSKNLRLAGGAELTREVKAAQEKRAQAQGPSPGDLFLDAAFRGDLGALHLIMRRDGVSASHSNSQGWTALHYCVFYDHEDCCQFLISQHCNVDARMANGVTPLLVAAQSGNVRLAKFLVERGADVSLRDEHGATAVYVASSLGHCSIVELLIAKGADLTAEDADGNTPLHVAAQEGQEQVVRLLLKHSGETELANRDGWTAVHYAARYGHCGVLQILEEHGAIVNSRTIEGATPLYLSTEFPQAVQFLIKSGAEVDARYTLTGNTPLYIACWDAHSKSAMILLESGADPDIRNLHNNTPLHAAAKSSGARLVSALITRGRADPNVLNVSGASPLYIAAASNNLQSVLGVAQFETVMVDLQTAEGSSPLYIACWKGYLDVAQALLRRKANPETPYRTGNTALIAAAYNGHKDICDLLLHYRAKINAVSNNGLTALHCATYRGFADVVQLLVLRGARTNIVAKNGRTAVDCCRDEPMRTLYRKLEQHKRQHAEAFKWKAPTPTEALFDPRLRVPDEKKVKKGRSQRKGMPTPAPAPVPSPKVAAATRAAMALLSPQHQLPVEVPQSKARSRRGKNGGGSSRKKRSWKPGQKDSRLEQLFHSLELVEAEGGEPHLSGVLDSLRGVARGSIQYGERVDVAVRQMVPRIRDEGARRDTLKALSRLHRLCSLPQAKRVAKKAPVSPPPEKHESSVLSDIDEMLRDNERHVDPDDLLAEMPDLDFDFGRDPRSSWPRKSIPPHFVSTSSSVVSPASSSQNSSVEESPRMQHSSAAGLRGTWPLADVAGDETESTEVVLDMEALDQDELDMLVTDISDFQFDYQ